MNLILYLEFSMQMYVFSLADNYKLYRFWTTTLECYNAAYLRFFLDDAFWSKPLINV